MATIEDFSLPIRLLIKAYPWRRIDPVLWTPLRKPLAESRLALVSIPWTAPTIHANEPSSKPPSVSWRTRARSHLGWWTTGRRKARPRNLKGSKTAIPS